MKYNGEQYLRAEHLLRDGKYIAAQVKISGIVEGCPLNNGKETMGLAFEKSDKVLGLNKTNYNMLCWELGDGIPQLWVGKSVLLVVRLIWNKKLKLHEPAVRIWPTVKHPNITRLADFLGIEITDEWYAKNRSTNRPVEDQEPRSNQGSSSD
jgi:hypothetical protein